MSRGIVTGITLSFSLLFISFQCAFAQDKGKQTVRIMFYNVENLFDTYNDPLTDDDEFTPDGLRRWTSGRYYRKLNSIFKTIIAAGGWEPPAFVALCEIENRKVIEDLVQGTNLSKYGYAIIHEDSPDERGIDVGMIYRKELAWLIDYRYLVPGSFSGSGFTTRSVLYARFRIESDTVHFFINHWPSRRGGVLAGSGQRKEIARMVREAADSVSLTSKNAKTIITGDFNAAPDDEALNILTEQHGSGAVFANLSAGITRKYGTYRYMGTWETIDQIVVSGSLLKSTSGITVSKEDISVFSPEFLLKPDPRYPGLSPFSTYYGYKYQGGFSDHLPILLDLILR